MALKAGYQGFKDVGDGLEVTNEGILQLTKDIPGITPNPEGEATETLSKIELEDTIYGLPETDLSKCYQTTDETESAIVDADYVPFFDNSAASGAGAPRKSTWSNFILKIKAKLLWDYSETEVDTGQKWIDGKDIYFKAVVSSWQNAPSSDTTWQTLNAIQGVDKVVKLEGIIEFDNTIPMDPPNFSTLSSGNYYSDWGGYELQAKVNMNNHQVDLYHRVHKPGYVSNVKVRYIDYVYYTKTS